MQGALFEVWEEAQFLDFHYVGPSFNGEMGLDALVDELQGVGRVLRYAAKAVAARRGIDLMSKDVQVFVEPFRKGSFKKRLRIVVRHVKKDAVVYDLALATVGTVIGILVYTHGLSASEIRTMSPELQARIGDLVKVELLKDRDFLRELSAFLLPLNDERDKLLLMQPGPSPKMVELSITDKRKMGLLWMDPEERQERVAFERVVGRVTRVDLDATINHIGFKVEDKGSTVKSTFAIDLEQERKKRLLGSWVRISGLVTYAGGEREKIEISGIEELVEHEQRPIPFMYSEPEDGRNEGVRIL